MNPERRAAPDRVMIAMLSLIGVLLVSAVTLVIISDQTSNNIRQLGTERLAAYQSAWETRYLDEVLTHSAARFAVSGDPVWRTRYDAAVVRLDQVLKTAEKLGGADALKPLNDVSAANQALIALETTAFDRASAGDFAGATAALGGEYVKQKAVYAQGLNAYFAQQDQKIARAIADARDDVRTLQAAMMGSLLAAVAGAVILLLAYRRKDRARRTAEHDVAASKTVLEGLLDGVQQRTTRLAVAARAMSSSSASLVSTTDESATRLSVVAATASEAADVTNDVRDSIDRLRTSISEITESAQSAATKAGNAALLTRQANATIESLGAASGEINDVLDVIAAIAAQTNLLALNATIEAARAGDTGKGFAIVASEVKHLAETTTQATNDIRTKIERLQGDSRDATLAIEQVTQAVAVVESNQTVIAAAVVQQSATTDGLGRNIDRLAGTSNDIQQTVGTVEESARTTAHDAERSRLSAAEVQTLTEELSHLLSSSTSR